LLHSAVESLHPPRKNNLKLLQHWIWDPKAGGRFLDAIEAQPYENNSVDGLVSLSEKSLTRDIDLFSNFLVDKLIPKLFELLALLPLKVSLR
jgi:hypothetical protein